jgi:hypothetical protein
MRIAGRVTLTAVLALTATAAAGADDAVAIVDRAIKASAGSEERLAKLKYCIRTEQGIMYFPTGPVPMTRESHLQLPDRMKWSSNMGPPGQQRPVTFCLDGFKGWSINNGVRGDLNQGQYEVMQDEAYFAWVASLLPLKNKGVTLTELKESSVNGQPARGVKVEARGRPAVQLYFDKSNGLLVKGVYIVRENSTDATREMLFRDFKEFEGLRLSTKLATSQSGRKLEEWTVERYRFPDKVDPAVFAKP